MKKLLGLINKGEKTEIEKLLNGSKLEGDINQLSDEGFSPLLYAIINDKNEIAELLLKYGADPNLGRVDNNDALYFAITEKKYSLIRSLVESGADLDFEYTTGKTAIDMLELEDDEQLEAAILGNAFDIDETKELELDNFVDVQNSGFIDLDSVDSILETKITGKSLPEDEKELKAVIFSGEDRKSKGVLNDRRGKEKKEKSQFDFGVNMFGNDDKKKGEIRNHLNKDTKINLGNGKKKKTGTPNWDSVSSQQPQPAHMRGKINNLIGKEEKALHLRGEINNKIGSDKQSNDIKIASDKGLGFVIPEGKLSKDQIDDLAQTLIDFKNEKGQNGLMFAAQAGNLDLVRRLIADGAEVNTLDYHGNSVLSYAVLGGNHNAIKYLVEKGARVNQKNNQGFTALFYALKNNDPLIFEILLKSSANTRMKYNGSPLLIIATRKKMYDFVELLIKYEADPRSRDNKYNKALDYAQRKNDKKLVRLLTDAENRLLNRATRKPFGRKKVA